MTGVVLSGERRVTLDEITARAARAARGFAKLGIGADGAVALMLRNDIAFFEAAMAAALVGAYAVPINWHFTAEEAGYILADCGARALVVHADLLAGIEAAIPPGVQVLVVPTPAEIGAAFGLPETVRAPGPDALTWDEFLTGHEPWTEPAPGSRTNMIYTSGTTGRPKGVRREPAPAAQQQRMAEMVALVFDITADRPVRTVITGPVYHAAPNFYALFAVQTGSFVVLQPRFDPEELLALIEQHRITHLHMVPTMFHRLLKLPAEVRERYDLSSLRFVVHAAAPCPPEIKRRMIEWWGPVINEYYGGTETGGVVFNTSHEALAKPGTVGKPLPGATIAIYDDDGRALGPDEIGEVYVRLGGWPDFTYNGDDAKRRAVERDGLITCGDVGYVDADGFLFLCDRKRDMVISGGVNIYPAEIEAALTTLPGVTDCAVFGIPDAEYGEALCAHVQPEPGVTLAEAEIRDLLAQHLARYKIPKVFEFVQTLPREDSGKIFKRKLRDPYWAEAGRRI